MTKYKLIESDKPGLYRVKALMDFSDVKAGDVGGYVSGEHNLSHEGDCWVYEDAIVSAEAKVYGNARVHGSALISTFAEVYGEAKVFQSAWVFGNAKVFDNARVYGYTKVYEDAIVSAEAKVYGNARVHGSALISTFAEVYGEAKVFQSASVFGEAKVYGNAKVYDTAQVLGDAQVYGEAVVFGAAKLSDNAVATRPVLNVAMIPYSMTVTDNHVAIGCERHPLRHWLENFKDIGTRHKMESEEIVLYGSLLNSFKHLPGIEEQL